MEGEPRELILYIFTSAAEPLSSATDSKGEDKDTLRVAVEHLFNKLYSK